MIVLKEEHFMAKGLNRSCYRHPFNEDLCIKVYPGEFKEKSLKQEISEIARLRRKRGSLIVPRYHGAVETNLGEGYVFDLIRDQRGRSMTFHNYIRTVSPEEALRAKELLFSCLFESCAVVADLTSGNILVLDDDAGLRFAAIDGLGEKTFMKLRSLSPRLARKRLKDKWSGIEREVASVVAESRP